VKESEIYYNRYQYGIMVNIYCKVQNKGPFLMKYFSMCEVMASH